MTEDNRNGVTATHDQARAQRVPGKRTTAPRENRPRAWPAGAERGKTPEKSISGDAYRRPCRLSDAALAGTAEYLATRGTTSNDRPAVADRHAWADAATNGFDTYCAELHGCTENETSTLQNDTKRYTSEINNFINGKRPPTPSPSVNAIVSGTDARGGTPTADEDGDRLATTDDTEVTLQTQHTDKDLAHVIDYLQHGNLPDDNKTARRVLLTKDNFAIRDGKLIHLGVKRQKNNGTEQPIAEQLCIPKQLQSTLLARYHAQLMHCGYEKMYLTLKQRVYWQNMYSDVRDYVAQCETCHVAKANRHPVKAKIQSREVPPEIFQRIHMDHVKIAVKNSTHRYTHALVLIDANSLCCELIPVKSTSAA